MTTTQIAGAGGCFLAGTQVQLEHGKTISIELVQVGDKVLAFDEDGNLHTSKVTKVHYHPEPQPILRVKFWKGDVFITPNHWVLNQYGSFIEVGALSDHDALVDGMGHLRPITGSEWVFNRPVWNLTVETHHTFIANGIRVHNGGHRAKHPEVTNIAGAGGGGGKGAGGRAAVEDVDSLQSRAVISIIDLLGEGQIGGLVVPPGGSAAESIFLNDTPLMSGDHVTYNFASTTTAVNWDFRDGQQSQTKVGIHTATLSSDVETPFALGVKIVKATPNLFTISDANVDSVKVIMSVSSLTSQDVSNGDIHGTTVRYQFAYSKNGASYVDYAGAQSITGKTRSKYQVSHLIDLAAMKPFATVTIRVTRITADSLVTSLSNDLYIDSYSTVYNSSMGYPNSALASISVDSAQFSSIPKRSYLVDGLFIKVPSNYTKVLPAGYSSSTNCYSGTWNGTFNLASCSNPAWVLYDLLTNTRYGLGQFITPSQIDKAALYAIGKYCDEPVPDGYGKWEPRFQINTQIATQAEAYKVISDITSAFRGMVYWANGMVGLTQDSRTDPSMIYGAANVIDGMFSYSGSARKDRHSVALVTYNDPTDLFTQKIEYVDSQAMIAKYGVRQLDVVAFGCTSRGQAARLGRWMLFTEQYETDFITFKVGTDSALVVPGNVVQINDPQRSGKRMSGRIANATANSLTFDAPVTLGGSGDTLTMRLPDGTLVSRVINESAGVLTTVTWTSALVTVPVANAMYILSEPSLTPMLARVVSIQQDAPGEYTIMATEYHDEKFAFVDSNIALGPMPTTSIVGTPLPPTSISVSDHIYTSGASLQTMLEISWVDSQPSIASWQVNVRVDQKNWTTYTVTAPVLEIPGVTDGSTYQINVFTKNFVGRTSSSAISATYTVIGKNLPPTSLSGVSTGFTSAGPYISWLTVSDLDLKVYEVRQGTVWANATLIGQTLGDRMALATQPYGATTFLVRALDTTGHYSALDGVGVVTVGYPGAPATFTGTIAGAVLTLAWSTVTSSQAIATYEVRQNGVLLGQVNANSMTVPATWSGVMPFTVAAIDVGGSTGTTATYTKTINIPTAPTSPTVTVSGTQYAFSWVEPASDILIDSYEVRIDGTSWTVGATSLGLVSALSLKGTVNWLGARTFRIKAKSITGYMGLEASAVLNVLAPNAPTISQPTYSNQNGTLVWADAKTTLPIASYAVSYGASFVGSTPIGTVNALTIPITANWIGSRRFWVVATDVAGNISGNGFVDVAITAPSAPVISQNIIANDRVALTWAASASSIAIAKYQVRVGATYAASTLAGETTSTAITFQPTWTGINTVYVTAIDFAGNVGTPASSSLTVTAPSAPAVTVSFTGPTAMIAWTSALQSLTIAKYEVRRGASWALGATQGTLSALSLAIPANWLGADTIWVMATDIIGNVGAIGSIGSSIPAPSTPTVALNIVGTSVLLSWNDCKTTLPISSYDVRLGTVWATGAPMGSASALTLSAPITWTGSNSIMVRANDSAGNAGVNGIVSANIVVPSVPTVAISYSGSSAIVSWTDATQTLPIAKYEIRRGAVWSSSAVVGTVSALSATIAADWLSADTIQVRATDINGNQGAAGVLSVSILAPAVPAVSFSFVANTAVLTWADCKTTLPILEYEVRAGTSWGSGTLVGIVSAKQFSIIATWTGSKTFWVAARDFYGNIGTAGSVVAIITVPLQPTVSNTIVGTDVLLSWTTPASSLIISGYEIRKGVAWAGGTLVGDISGNNITVPISWLGAQTFWVAATDSANNYGAASSTTTTISSPIVPIVSSVIKDTSLTLSWTASAGTLSVDHYEIRLGSGTWAAATFVAAALSTSLTMPINWTGSNTYQVAAIDAAGNLGVAGTLAVTIAAPAAPSLTPSFNLDQFVIAWTTPASTLPVRSYEVRYGTTSSTWATATSVGTVSGTTYSITAQWAGARRWFIAATDAAGNVGAVASSDVTISAPGIPASSQQVVDNNILLYWSCTAGTLPINTFELRRGTTWALASLIGRKSGGFTTIFETAAGTYTYWIAGIDTAGNYGPPISAVASVAQPPDYVLRASITSTWSGTKTNMGQVDDGSWLLPVNSADTFATHFTSNAWTSPQDQITAGFPIYAQPAKVGTATYVEVYDYGTVIGGSKITLSYSGNVISGAPTIQTNIDVSLDGATWTNNPNVAQFFASNFRYVRVTIAVAAATTLDLYQLVNFGYRLDSKLKGDAGMGNAGASDSVSGNNATVNGTTVNGSNPTVNGVRVPDGNGTLVLFAQGFVSITALDVSVAAGTTAVYGIYDFLGVANPTGFKVILYNSAGTRVAGSFSWSARGY